MLTDTGACCRAGRRFRREASLTARTVEQMMLGSATRKCERLLEPVARGLPPLGASKSAVSRRFVGHEIHRRGVAEACPQWDRHGRPDDRRNACRRAR